MPSAAMPPACPLQAGARPSERGGTAARTQAAVPGRRCATHPGGVPLPAQVCGRCATAAACASPLHNSTQAATPRRLPFGGLRGFPLLLPHRNKRRRLAITPVEIDPDAEAGLAEAAGLGGGAPAASLLCGGPPAGAKSAALDF